MTKPMKNEKPNNTNEKPIKAGSNSAKPVEAAKPVMLVEVAKAAKVVKGAKPSEATEKLLVAADLMRDARTIAVEKQTRDVFTEERATDPIDVSSQTETKMLYASISAVVDRLKPQYHKDFDGIHCLDCGDKMPIQRLLDRRIRCTPCEEVIEKKGKMRA